jgi:hypothetical protein
MIGGGSSHVDVNLMVAHLPDGDWWLKLRS